MKKAKLKVAIIETREEMEAVVSQVCEWTIFRDKTKALMDERIQEIRAEYETQLSDAETRLGALLGLAKTWADRHPEVFGKARSIELVHGTVGYRTCPPAVKMLRGWKVEKAIATLAAMGKQFQAYIRVRMDIDKDAVLRDYDGRDKSLGMSNALGMANKPGAARIELALVGLKVSQDETFYIDPKREAQDPVRQTA